MRMAGSGRFVFVAQWVAAVLLPVFFFLGRSLVGAELGWLALVGIVYGIFVILILLVPPLLTLFDTEGRRRRSTRLLYDISSFVLWAGLVVGALTAPDSGDSGHLDSAFTTWTGASYEVSQAIFIGAAEVTGIAYLAQLVTAIIGIVRGRRVAAS
ncbi:hypothetical protein G5T42_05990 [Microbacterium sp. 4R-513]|uniref:hypothetical protein n=1 Tax=Microbacterium sp. 4R-513 TaxID=2567934 RepID=UPI0013E20831|nr:hypothetical protein [Microbacterium sp. 4R-513]QIG39093.1 hypothetical protein G5T42_05990 [Microbacterium sp. 4R-513]